MSEKEWQRGKEREKVSKKERERGKGEIERGEERKRGKKRESNLKIHSNRNLSSYNKIVLVVFICFCERSKKFSNNHKARQTINIHKQCVQYVSNNRSKKQTAKTKKCTKSHHNVVQTIVLGVFS